MDKVYLLYGGEALLEVYDNETSAFQEALFLAHAHIRTVKYPDSSGGGGTVIIEAPVKYRIVPRKITPKRKGP